MIADNHTIGVVDLLRRRSSRGVCRARRQGTFNEMQMLLPFPKPGGVIG